MTEPASTNEVTARWTGEKRFLCTSARGPGLIIDAVDGGAGMKPTEALLAALGTCAAVDVVEILRKKRMILDSYRVELTGQRAATPPRRYERVTVKHVVKAAGLTESALEQAVKLSTEKYCSVAATLNAELVSEWEVEVLAVDGEY